MSADGISCKKLIPHGQGISYVDVGEVNGSPIVDVYFFANVPDTSDLSNYKNYRIIGGERINIKVIQAIRSNENRKRVRLFVDSVGDFSNYILQINSKELDPFFAHKMFIFRPDCQAEFDCKIEDLPEDEMIAEELQTIDYMAKDYDSFRQALLDLVPSKAPGWLKLSEADFGVVLIELMSYVADRLSYYQDRVANEAFLETARHRFSIKSHLSLIDYALGNGMAAGTFLHIDAKEEALIQKGFPASSKNELEDNGSTAAFGTNEDGYVSPVLNRIKIYHGSSESCLLKKGTTNALLLLESDSGSLALGSLLRKEDYLLFEENDKREVVRLIKDAQEIEIPEVTDQHAAVVRVSWSENEKLTYDYDVSKGAECKGNIIPASHGKTIEGELLKIYKSVGVPVDSFDSEVTDDVFAKLEPTLLPIGLNQTYFTLANSPLTYLPREKINVAAQQVTSSRQIDAYSTLQLYIDGELWTEVPSLLETGPFDKSYEVFVDEDGFATVIFGNGINGKRPADDGNIKVTYKVGTGSAGNIGYNVLREFPEEFSDIVERVTNPLPGTNGVDLESIEEAKMLGPKYIKRQQRAVTPQDYESVAQEHKLVSRAKARFVWTGSWYTVFVNIDPKESHEMLSRKEREARIQNIQNEVKEILIRKKMAGYDIQVNPPNYVPLRLELIVCVKPDFFVIPIKQSVENVLSDSINLDGNKGFFYPDNITFGQPIFISDIYKAVMVVPGVLSVTIKNIRRISDPDEKSKDYLDIGYLSVGYTEIARLDNDRNFPELGILDLEIIGGKSGGSL